MIFARPDLLLWLLAVPVAGLLAAWAAGRRRRVAAGWGQGAAAVAAEFGRRRLVRNLLFGLALAGVVFALAQPRGGAQSRLLHRQGSDIVFVLDLSKSMLAADVSPNRLQRGVFEIQRLLDELHGDHVGLVVFAGSAFMQAPLTTDYAVVRNMLQGLDPLSMPYPGSNLAEGIDKGLELLRAAPKGGRGLVVLTDGEETAGRAREAADRARAEDIPIYVIAVGTPRGEPIPAPAAEGGLLRGPDGKPVFSKLDEDGLREIARKSGGKFFALGAPEAVEAVLQGLDKKSLEERTVTERAELYPLALGPALLFFMVALWFDTRYSL